MPPTSRPPLSWCNPTTAYLPVKSQSPAPVTRNSLKRELRTHAERRPVVMRSRRAPLDDAEAELRRLIRAGFEQGTAGEKLAEAAELSVPRAYQIRDGRR